VRLTHFCRISNSRRYVPSNGVEMKTSLAPGLHVPQGRAVDSAAYDRWTGRWSRLFVPMVLAAAEVQAGHRVLDVSTGTGEAALAIMPIIGSSGVLVGADIATAMLEGARGRLNEPAFLPVATDGQALPFADASFDAVICQLGLQFFPNPGLGLTEFRRVLRDGGRVGVCVISTPDRAPMWGILADVLGRLLPDQRSIVQLSFSLADPPRLEGLFTSAGFRDIRVEHQRHEGVIDSFDEYWEPIAAGTGSIPQIYLTLPESERDAVREEVRTRLAEFQSGERLRMSVEMLIASGRA
jgi:ubiquinone/menaquinone biosynthesis C-methylase UbiE